jgi:hypothetical protein
VCVCVCVCVCACVCVCVYLRAHVHVRVQVRYDFTLSEVDSKALWLREAWRIKRVIELTREAVNPKP